MLVTVSGDVKLAVSTCDLLWLLISCRVAMGPHLSDVMIGAHGMDSCVLMDSWIHHQYKQLYGNNDYYVLRQSLNDDVYWFNWH